MSEQTAKRAEQGKRGFTIPWGEVTVTIGAFVLALLVGAILMIMTDPNVAGKYTYFFSRPSDALVASWDKVAGAYSALASGAFGSWVNITNSTAEAAPLICAGLAVALAFRAGLFNIGAQGQAMWGAILGAWVGFSFAGLPMIIHLPLAIILGMIGGALWGGLAGFLKAKTGAHEVIVTIMLNYIASLTLAWLLTTQAFLRPGRSDPIAPIVNWNAAFPRIDGTRLSLGIVLALLAAVATWWLLDRTTLGFRIRAVGANPNASATAGMSVSNTTIVTMTISGALAGLAGVQYALTPTLLTGMPPALAGGLIGTVGFDAITVALLGRSKPLGVVLAGLLFGGLRAGGLTMQAQAQTPAELTSVLQALIVLFVAAPALVRTILPFLKQRKKKVDAPASAPTKEGAAA